MERCSDGECQVMQVMAKAHMTHQVRGAKYYMYIPAVDCGARMTHQVRGANNYMYIPDFLKTVGPDRQKCSRTDDFKIYIRPNVWYNSYLRFCPKGIDRAKKTRGSAVS